MLGYAKRNIAIATSVGAMALSVLLIIFFGAWAVSASGDAGVSTLLSGATAGFSGDPLTAANAKTASDANAAGTDPTSGDTAPRLASATAGNRAAADTWWGKAFLTACPLH